MPGGLLRRSQVLSSAAVLSLVLAASFVFGGLANPLYALFLAYTNDFLEYEQMAAAGGRLVFITGVGAIFGPIIIGGVINAVGPPGFFLFLAALMAFIALYAAYRMTVRPGAETGQHRKLCACPAIRLACGHGGRTGILCRCGRGERGGGRA